MSATISTPRPVTTQAVAPAHTPFEDVLGILTGATMASFGLFLLKSAHAVTGGTAGVALLLSYVAPVPLGVLLILANLPFLLLAVRRKGLAFTLKTIVTIALVSGLTSVHAAAFHLEQINTVWAVLLGNAMAGLGVIVLFRHGSSIGGFGIVALVAQERLGWRAGYVQMALDVVVVTCAFSVVAPGMVLLSAAGAVLMNLLIALNHRPGRYLGTR